MRCRKKKTKSGQSADTGRQTHGDGTESQSIAESEQDSEANESVTENNGNNVTETAVSTLGSLSKKSGAKRRKDIEASLLNYINTPITVEVLDKDKSFFDSLLPMVRKFNEDEKLEFRSEMLNLVKRMRQRSTSYEQLHNNQARYVTETVSHHFNADVNQFPFQRQECDLGQQSILHAVKSRMSSSNGLKSVDTASEGSRPLCETLVDLQLQDADRAIQVSPEEHEKKRAHFYVYCASPCRSMRTGKLRVRCNHCKGGAVIVDRDPQCWDDVLLKDRITGDCQNEGCVDSNDGPKFVEFYFKCAEHASQGEDDQSVPLHLIKANIHDVPCLACSDISDPVLVFSCNAGHVTCLDCFRTYCLSRLRDRQFWSHPEYGYTLPCPAGCQDSLITEVHHFRLLSPEQYAQYQRFGTEEYVLQAGGVLCPQPGCGMGILVEPDCKKVTCINGCGFVFCRLCLQGFHLGDCLPDAVEDGVTGGCEYSVDPSRAAQSRWDDASKVTIKVLTKPCPKCRTPTERDGGCMHMVCTRAQCGFEWCWVCQVEWSRDCMGSHWFG